MISISIREDTQGELIRIARRLQKEVSDKTDFDSVIRFLIDSYLRRSDQKKQRSIRDRYREEEGKPRDNPHQS